MAATNEKELSRVDRFLNTIERVCNKLPPPAILFCILFLIVAFVGMFFTFSGFGLENPATHKVVYSQNLFTKEGVQWLLTSMVKNFTGFAPLGLVITMTMAIGFCEESGMLVAMLRRSMKNVPPNIVPFLIAFLGTVGNIASDTAMVVIPPLAALVYIGVKKNPVVGMIVGYAGAQAGFTANLMIAGTDSLLQGLTNQAIDAFLGTPGKFVVDVTCNWYFMIASTFLCSLVIGLVSTRIVEPRFPVYHSKDEDETIQEVTLLEVKGLHRAGFAVVLYIAILAIGFFAGVLSKDGHTLVGSLLLKGLIPILFFLFSIAGITYGITTGSFKSVKDVNKAMVKQMSGMGLRADPHRAADAVYYRAVHRLYPHYGPHQHLCFERLCQVGHPRSDLRSDVHAPWLPSWIYPAHLSLGRLSGELLYPDVSLHLDDPFCGPGKIHA